MNYNDNNNKSQLINDNFIKEDVNLLHIPTTLKGFYNTDTNLSKAKSGRNVICFNGILVIDEIDCICDKCGKRMEIHNNFDTTIRHLCFGSNLSCLNFNKKQFYCTNCHHSKMQTIPFKAEKHRITKELLQYTKDLLATNKYTNKQVAEITGLGKNTVKAIDLERLKEKYTIDGKLIKPEENAKYLGIDEFKLHNGHVYATHIINMETGHILWIAEGKKKQVVYDFIDHVGLEWMDNVEAVACDMNSDFQEAFEEKCPHIQPVFDYFHIVKNFNEKVVSEVRKDEQKRLKEEGNEEAAKQLKGSKYILTSSRETLQKKDKDAIEGKVVKKGSSLFGTSDIIRTGDYENRYNELIKENKLLFMIDIIKDKLKYAYSLSDEAKMSKEIIDIIDLCKSTKNRHFFWFANLLDSHFEGIIAHATYKISAGKIEGINNKIKTLRRQGYGYPDDEYFFLKLFDMSRQSYVRNVKSHKVCD